MARDRNLRRIKELNPVTDHCEIYHLTTGYEFPWDIRRALEIALFRTFCVPSISALLDRTGEFYHRPQKRYDDTTLIITRIAAWGYDSDRGREAIERMNRIHSRFQISNEDFLYVLSLFIYEPIRWNERFGWRLMCENEKQAAFYFWQALGERMHIHNIPDTYEAFQRYSQDYEKEHFNFSEANRRIGEATRNLLLSWFPRPLRPTVEAGFYALLDNTMRQAFGFPAPPKQLSYAIETALKLRGRALRWFPPRKRPGFYSDTPTRSYPNGYTIEDLGPPSETHENEMTEVAKESA